MARDWNEVESRRRLPLWVSLAAVLVAVAWVLVGQRQQQSTDLQYATRQDALADELIGDVVKRCVPEGATDVRRRFDADTRYVWLRFVPPDEGPPVGEEARKIVDDPSSGVSIEITRPSADWWHEQLFIPRGRSRVRTGPPLAAPVYFEAQGFTLFTCPPLQMALGPDGILYAWTPRLVR